MHKSGFSFPAQLHPSHNSGFSFPVQTAIRHKSGFSFPAHRKPHHNSPTFFPERTWVPKLTLPSPDDHHTGLDLPFRLHDLVKKALGST